MKKIKSLSVFTLLIAVCTFGLYTTSSFTKIIPDEADGFEWDTNHVTLDHDPQTGVSSGDYYFTTISGHSVVVIDLDSPAGNPDGTWSSSGAQYTFSPNLSYPSGDGHWQITTHNSHDVIILNFD